MISRDCIITVNGNTATIDSDIYLYKYDKNIQLSFTITNSKYMYDNDDSNNLIKSMQAAYAQAKFKKNDSSDIEIEFDIQATNKGAVLLTINEELTDEDTELGEYTIQIRLLDANKNSVVTLPPVESCIHILAPLFEKMGANTNEVNKAVVNKAVARYAAPLSATTEDGTFNSKTWVDGDTITTAELNRMETGIKTNSTQYKDIANLSLAKGTDGKVYIKKQDGTLIGDGIEIGGSDVDLSKISMSMSGQTLKLLNDGTQIATVEIPTATVTDEQLTTIIQSKIDDGTLSALTIEDGSIGNIKLSAIGQQRINLLNINTSTSGKKINKFNYIGDNADYDLSDYIEIELNTLYYVIGADTRSIQYCLYDNSKKFIIGGEFTFVKNNDNGDNIRNTTLTVENAKYIRFSYIAVNKDRVIFCKDKIRDYVPYDTVETYLTAEGEKLRNTLNKDYKITPNNVADSTITPTMTNFCFSDDLNLVDCDNRMECENSVMKLYYSNYFMVNNGETLYTNKGFNFIYFYDKYKNFLSKIGGATNSTGALNQTEVTINQENVYYARIVYPLSYFTDKKIMVTRYKGEQNTYKEFATKWFELKDDYKEYFIKNVLSVSYFGETIKDILLPYVSPTAGKTLLAFGDSLMQYAGGGGSNDYGFFSQANKYLNMDMHNLGYAGSAWTGTGVGDCKARINKLISDGIAYDVILLGWGTNPDADLGTIEDAPSDSGSMCAVMKWAVQQIRANFPHSGLGIILPPPGVSGGNEEKVNLIKSCCEHSSMHVPYLDLFHSANITTTPIGTGGLGDDQVHLGEHGRNRYASALKPFIEKLVPYIKNYLFTYNLTNVTASKTYKRISEGTNITINLTASEGHTLDDSSVIVTMGGVDVTSNVYNNGKITIVVTGDIIITASAS
jgi:lysophospholipase L1-like esterase|nr:MAG TPA: SGNH-hydrolase family esterase [Caudoviricetes sp.]